jgi:hypothetical protein
MAANYFLKHITKLHPGWRGLAASKAERRMLLRMYSISRKTKGAR